jgi:hypothetical protein
MSIGPIHLHITNPGEAAQIIPYLVGFTPEESLVISAIQNRRILVTARVDLADVTAGGAAEDLLDRIWARYPDADAHATVYTTGDHNAAWKLLARCDAWLPYGCQAMIVDGDTWHTPDGASGRAEPTGLVAAGASLAGLQHLEHRSDLEARFASPPDSDQLASRANRAVSDLPAPGETAQILARTKELFQRHLPGRPAGLDPRIEPPVIPAEDAIRLAALVHHPDARDLALLSIDRRNASQHLVLWQQVVQASPSSSADMPLYLAGMAAWISGDGAGATIAVERALNSHPTSATTHPAEFLEGILEQVMPPTSWDLLRGILGSDLSPAVRHALNPEAATPPPPMNWPPAPQPTVARRDHQRRQPPSPGIAI